MLCINLYISKPLQTHCFCFSSIFNFTFLHVAHDERYAFDCRRMVPRFCMYVFAVSRFCVHVVSASHVFVWCCSFAFLHACILFWFGVSACAWCCFVFSLIFMISQAFRAASDLTRVWFLVRLAFCNCVLHFCFSNQICFPWFSISWLLMSELVWSRGIVACPRPKASQQPSRVLLQWVGLPVIDLNTQVMIHAFGI